MNAGLAGFTGEASHGGPVLYESKRVVLRMLGG